MGELNRAEAYFQLAESARQQGKSDDAVVFYRKANLLKQNISPQDRPVPEKASKEQLVMPIVKSLNQDIKMMVETYIQQAQAYLTQGKTEAAIAACQQVLQVMSNNALAYKLMGNAMQMQGGNQNAMRCYIQAIEIAPDFAEVYANLGSLYASQQKWQQAIAAYQKAIEIKPDFAGAYRNLAKIWQAIGNTTQANTYQERALTLEPEQEKPDHRNNIQLYPPIQSQASKHNGNGKGVINSINSIILNSGDTLESSADRETVETYLAKAKSYLAAQRWQEAINLCQQAIQSKPDAEDAYKILGNVMQSVGKTSEAMQFYNQALQIQPKFAEVHANLGSLYVQQQQWESALSHYQAAIAAKPDFVGAYRNLEKILTQLGRFGDAAECKYKRLELDLECASAEDLTDIGNILFRHGKVDRAIAAYKQVIQKDPNFMGAYFNLATILSQQGKLAEANEYYRKAIGLNMISSSGAVSGQQSVGGNQKSVMIDQIELPQSFSIPSSILPSIWEDPDDYLHLADVYLAKHKYDRAIAVATRAMHEPSINAQQKVDGLQILGSASQSLGKMGDATEAYLKILQLQPNLAEVHDRLGSIYTAQRKWSEAVSAYQKSIALNPTSANTYRQLAQVWMQSGNQAEGAECWFQSFQLEPTWATAEEHLNLGNMLLGQNKMEQAVSSYHQAIAINPHLSQAHHNLGEIASNQGNWEEAIASYHQAILTNPQSVTSHYGLGKALTVVGNAEAAISAYRGAIAIDPDYFDAYDKMAEVFATQANWEAAVNCYQEILERQPDRSDLRNKLAHTLGKLGDSLITQSATEEAIAAYQEAISLHPMSMGHHKLGDILNQHGRYREAISAYREAINLNPTYSWSHNNLGDAFGKLQAWGESSLAYREAISLNPEFVWSHYNLGEVSTHLRAWDDAIASYRNAIKLQPDIPYAQEKLGNACRSRAQQDLQEALICYRQAIQAEPDNLQNYHKAIDILPNDPELYVELANALARQGNHDGAIVFYQMALQLQPDNREISSNLDRILKKKSNPTLSIKTEEFEQDRSKVTNSKILSAEILHINEQISHSLMEVTSSDILSAGISGKTELTANNIRLIAFYLPQYHPIPENDLWWGKGFTEWTNVSRAKPLFEGHYQPHLPADLGFYDLRVPEVRDEQAKLAQKYGIHGFCYYYYWFAGKRLLERPLDDMLISQKPDFPFCICWANENWSRRWDGSENDILIGQEHSLENNRAFAESLIPFFKDERYIRVNGKPLLVVYRANILPDTLQTTQQWREVFREHSIGEIYLCGALTFGLSPSEIAEMGFDSSVEFPPHGTQAKPIPPSEFAISDFKGNVYDFGEVVEKSLNSSMPTETSFLSVMTGWDNSARKGKSAHIYLNSNPDTYEFWLRGAIEKTQQKYQGDEQLVFVNAWNEWAEGTHLEPDRKHGHDYLISTQKALTGGHSLMSAFKLLRFLCTDNYNHFKDLISAMEERIELKRRSLEEMLKLSQKVKTSNLTVFSIEHEPLNGDLTGYIESPNIGCHYQNSDYLGISGWVSSKKSRPSQVELSANNRIIGIAPVNIYRSDVCKVIVDIDVKNCGFSIYSEIQKLSCDKVDVNVLLEDGTVLKLASINFIISTKNLLLPAKLRKQIEWDNVHQQDISKILQSLRKYPLIDNFQETLDELEFILSYQEETMVGLSEFISCGSFTDLF